VGVVFCPSTQNRSANLNLGELLLELLGALVGGVGAPSMAIDLAIGHDALAENE